LTVCIVVALKLI